MDLSWGSLEIDLKHLVKCQSFELQKLMQRESEGWALGTHCTSVDLTIQRLVIGVRIKIHTHYIFPPRKPSVEQRFSMLFLLLRCSYSSHLSCSQLRIECDPHQSQTPALHGQIFLSFPLQGLLAFLWKAQQSAPQSVLQSHTAKGPPLHFQQHLSGTASLF